MTPTEARRLLLLHAVMVDDGQTAPLNDQAILDRGFLGMLRPYRGLIEANFHEVMQALLIVGEDLHKTETLDREVIAAVWDMLFLARSWGIRPYQMLQRNKLITADDVVRLEKYLDTIEQTILKLLRGRPPKEAIHVYAGYLSDQPPGENIGFFIELMNDALADTEDDHWDIVTAIGSIGARARLTLPRLIQCLEHPPNVESVDLRNDYHQLLQETIRKIEQP